MSRRSFQRRTGPLRALFGDTAPVKPAPSVAASNRPEDSLRPVMPFGDKTYLTSLTFGEAEAYKAPDLDSKIIVALYYFIPLISIAGAFAVALWAHGANRWLSPEPLSSIFGLGLPVLLGLTAGILVGLLTAWALAKFDDARSSRLQGAAREPFMKLVGAEKFLAEVPRSLTMASAVYWNKYSRQYEYPRILESYARKIHRNKAKLSRGTPGRSPELPANVGNQPMEGLTDALAKLTMSQDMHERGRLSVLVPKLFAELDAASVELDQAANRAHYG